MAAKDQRIYLRAKRLIDPETGAEVSAFIPAGAADYAQLREKGMKIGGLYRALITRPRNYEFHKLAHKLSCLCRDNIPEFAGMGTHEVLKKLQTDAQLECDVTVTEIPGIGTLHSVQARSIAFDAMPQDAFWALMQGIYRHIEATHWPTTPPEEIHKMVEMMPGID